MSEETKNQEVEEVVATESQETATVEKKEKTFANANVEPDSFDWESFESGLDEEDRKEKAELEEMYENTLEELNENEVFKSQRIGDVGR